MTDNDLAWGRLHRGDIVERPPHRGRPAGERGVVIYAHGTGAVQTGPYPLPYTIQLGPGLTVATSNSRHDPEWRIVPEDEQTLVERALSAEHSWDPMPGEDGVLESDQDTREWAMLMALLPADERDRLTQVDWPDLAALVKIVAARMDDLDRLAFPKSLTTAMLGADGVMTAHQQAGRR